MKITKMTLGAALLTIAISSINTSAWAGIVNQRSNNQDERIARGVANGSLTADEAAKLQTAKDRIETNRQNALADGTMSLKEGEKIMKQENKLSKDIIRLSNNKQTSVPQL